jgi:MFS superfamily sulfate permease-like transporter
MLVYTGFRLAHPREFVHAYRIGPEQLIIYAATIIAVLATDLLIGIAIGIGVKFLIHIMSGVPIRSLFRPYTEVEAQDDDTCQITVKHAAVFSHWIMFKRQIEREGLKSGRNVVLDLSQTRLVDHTVMEKLHELQREFAAAGLALKIVGLQDHRSISSHPHSTRRKRKTLVAPGGQI